MSYTPQVFTADATSAVVDGAAGPIANGATMVIGGAAPAKHAFLRFLTSAIADAETIVSARITLTEQTATSTINVDVWASNFSTGGVANGNYNGAINNTVGLERIPLDTALTNTAIVGTVGTVVVPNRYVNKLAAVNGGFSDFEVRPGAGYVAGAGAFATIGGPANGTAAIKPTLTIISLTNTELRSKGIYRFVAIGAESWVAFNIEANFGQAVRAKTFLDHTRTGLEGEPTNIPSKAMNKSRTRPRKMGVGRSGAGGPISFELTPEKWVQLLPGFMLLQGSTGPVSGIYTHTFKACRSDQIKSYTFVQKEGAFRKVFPGCLLSSLSLRCDLDSAIDATLSVVGLEAFLYDVDAAGGQDQQLVLGTAGYDTTANGILTFVGGQVSFDGVVDSGLVRSCEIGFNQDVREQRGLSRTRGPNSLYALGFHVNVSFTMYLVNEDQMRRYSGDATQDFPTRPGQSMIFQSVELRFAGSLGASKQEIIMTMPKTNYVTVREAVDSEDAIMLTCSGIAYFNDAGTLADTASGQTNVQVQVVNSEPGTVYSAADVVTDYSQQIVVLPAGVPLGGFTG